MSANVPTADDSPGLRHADTTNDDGHTVLTHVWAGARQAHHPALVTLQIESDGMYARALLTVEGAQALAEKLLTAALRAQDQR